MDGSEPVSETGLETPLKIHQHKPCLGTSLQTLTMTDGLVKPSNSFHKLRIVRKHLLKTGRGSQKPDVTGTGRHKLAYPELTELTRFQEHVKFGYSLNVLISLLGKNKANTCTTNKELLMIYSITAMHAQSSHLVKGQYGHQKSEVSFRKDHHGLEEDKTSYPMVVASWLKLVSAKGVQGNHRKNTGLAKLNSRTLTQDT